MKYRYLSHLLSLVCLALLLFWPSGASADTLTGSVTVGGTMIVGTDAGHVWISTNDGASWLASGAGLPDTSIKQLVKVDAHTAWACTHDGVYASGGTPMGLRWTLVTHLECRRMAVSGRRVLVMGGLELHYSHDGGKHFHQVNVPGAPPNVTDLALLPGHGPGVWLVSALGMYIFRSRDGGRRWKLVRRPRKIWNGPNQVAIKNCNESGVNSQWSFKPHRLGGLHFAFGKKRRVWAGPIQWWCEQSGSKPFAGGVDFLYSDDGGQRWKTRAVPAPAGPRQQPRASYLRVGVKGKLWASTYGFMSVLDPATGRPSRIYPTRWPIVGAAPKGLPFVTSDRVCSSQHCMWLLHPPRVLQTATAFYSARGHSIFRRANGATKSVNVYTGLSGAVLAIAADKKRVLVATNTGKLFATANQGFSWTVVGKSPSAWTTAMVQFPRSGKPSRLVAGGVDGLFFSDDGGQSWKPATGKGGKSPLTSIVWTVRRLKPATGKSAGVLLATTYHGVLVSRDGQSWSPLGDRVEARSISIIDSPRLPGRAQPPTQALIATNQGALVVSLGSDSTITQERVTRGLPKVPLSNCESSNKQGDLLDQRVAGYRATGKRPHVWREPTAARCVTSTATWYEYLTLSHRFRGYGRPAAPRGAIRALFDDGTGRLVAAVNVGTGAHLEFASSDQGATWSGGESYGPWPIERQFVKPALGGYAPILSLRGVRRQPWVWMPLTHPPKQGKLMPRYHDCATDPKNAKNVYCLQSYDDRNDRTHHAIVKSADGGISFKRMAELPGHGIAVSPRNSQQIWAGGSLSTDSGWTFKPVTDNGKGHLRYVLPDGRAIIWQDPGTLLLVSPSGARQTLLADSPDVVCHHGGTPPWLYCAQIPQVKPNEPKGSTIYAAMLAHIGPRTFRRLGYFPLGHVHAIWVSGKSPRLLLGTQFGIWASDDLGQTWYAFDGATPPAGAFAYGKHAGHKKPAPDRYVRPPITSWTVRDGCNKGNLKACNKYGAVFEFGLGGTLKNYDMARKLYQRACAGGLASGCNHLGILYQYGRGVPKNDKRALQYYRKACARANAPACTNMAGMYQRGEGVTADPAQAKKLYQQACGEGDVMGCKSLKRMK